MNCRSEGAVKGDSMTKDDMSRCHGLYGDAPLASQTMTACFFSIGVTLSGHAYGLRRA